ncbi:MAG TPA: universal stress protein [Chitinophagaceae bacterium]|nr:universal stress protein [Chitinophagaceae bacterium]
MKTLIVCTDFSAPALHAAEYACMLTREYPFEYITLLHAHPLMAHTTALPISDYDPDAPDKAAMEQLNQLREQLQPLAGKKVLIRMRTENISVEENIDRVFREENADLVVVASSLKSKLEGLVIGSNAANISRNSMLPVLIIPEKARIQPIRNILFAYDLKSISQPSSVKTLKEILDFFNVPLSVLNVDHKDKHFTPDTPQAVQQLHTILDGYKPGYAYIDHRHIAEGILEYAYKNDTSLIITIPRTHNFFERLFKKSETSKLIHESDIPLLTLHE